MTGNQFSQPHASRRRIGGYKRAGGSALLALFALGLNLHCKSAAEEHHLTQVIFDMGPEQLKWFPIADTDTDYRKDAIARIMRNFRLKGRRYDSSEGLLVLVKVSNTGKLLKIEAVRTDVDVKVNKALFDSAIRAIQATSFAPLPKDVAASEFTFAFDLHQLVHPGASNSDAVPASRWEAIPTGLYRSNRAIPSASTPPAAPLEPEPLAPDSDTTSAAKAAWSDWDKKQVETVRANLLFICKNRIEQSQPTACTIRYSVTKSGKIDGYGKDKSKNVVLNALAFTAVMSLNNQLSLLQFPPGSRCVRVEKVMKFSCPPRNSADVVDISTEVVLMEFEMDDGTFVVRRGGL